MDKNNTPKERNTLLEIIGIIIATAILNQIIKFIW